MTTVHDVPAKELVDVLGEKMKTVKEVSPPEWSRFVKTGVHKQRPPIQEDWWFIRCGALLRTIYVHGPVGVERLRTKYGGRKDRGSKKEHFRKGSGNVIRKCLQQLETAGLVEKDKKGRKISKKGIKLVDNAASEMIKNADKGK
jgi:small subunit ribosomal protein S19e